MTFINSVLKSFSLELVADIYSLWSGVLFFALLNVINLIYLSKCKKTSVWKYIVIFFVPFVVNNLITIVIGAIRNVLSLEFPVTFIICFIPILLVNSIIISIVGKIEFIKVIDWFALACMFARPAHCLGCLIAGCCHGEAVDWGLYSHSADSLVVPLRAYELLLVLLIWGINNTLYFKRKFKYNGQCASWCIIAFGIVTFYVDLFCVDAKEIVFSLSPNGFASLMIVLFGILMLFYMSRKSQKN